LSDLILHAVVAAFSLRCLSPDGFT